MPQRPIRWLENSPTAPSPRAGFAAGSPTMALTEFPAEANRYHLYIAVPARGRTGRHCANADGPRRRDRNLVRRSDPKRRHRLGVHRRRVRGSTGFDFLARAYTATVPDDARVTDVDKQSPPNSTKSWHILRMLRHAFARFAAHPVELCPAGVVRRDRRTQRRHLRQRQQCGLQGRVRAPAGRLRERGPGSVQRSTSTRAVLHTAVRRGPVETDWRLFTTLVRFDAVYQIHFKCSIRKLSPRMHLWPYARDLFQWPGVAETGPFALRSARTTTAPTR